MANAMKEGKRGMGGGSGWKRQTVRKSRKNDEDNIPLECCALSATLPIIEKVPINKASLSFANPIAFQDLKCVRVRAVCMVCMWTPCGNRAVFQVNR